MSDCTSGSLVTVAMEKPKNTSFSVSMFIVLAFFKGFLSLSKGRSHFFTFSCPPSPPQKKKKKKKKGTLSPSLSPSSSCAFLSARLVTSECMYSCSSPGDR